jgi:predicted  nucleic acid-binding Zn-ribbon protein
MSELQLSLRSAQAALEMETQQLASTKAELEQVSTAQQHTQQELERLTQQVRMHSFHAVYFGHDGLMPYPSVCC